MVRFGSIQVRFRKSDENHVFHPICVGIPIITPTCSIAAIKKHVCVQKLAALTTRKAYTIDPNWQCLSARAYGFSSNQNGAAINSKSDLWRTALLWSGCISHGMGT